MIHHLFKMVIVFVFLLTALTKVVTLTLQNKQTHVYRYGGFQTKITKQYTHMNIQLKTTLRIASGKLYISTSCMLTEHSLNVHNKSFSHFLTSLIRTLMSEESERTLTSSWCSDNLGNWDVFGHSAQNGTRLHLSDTLWDLTRPFLNGV